MTSHSIMIARRLLSLEPAVDWLGEQLAVAEALAATFPLAWTARQLPAQFSPLLENLDLRCVIWPYPTSHLR